MKVINAENTCEDVGNDPSSKDYISEELMKKLNLGGGKVSFPHMGKLIGSRWKTIEPECLKKCTDLATIDKRRYDKEMQDYNCRQEERMRAEALLARPLQAPHGEIPAREMGPPADSQGSFVQGNARSCYPSSEYGPELPYSNGYGYYGRNMSGYSTQVPMPGYFGVIGSYSGGSGADIHSSHAQIGEGHRVYGEIRGGGQYSSEVYHTGAGTPSM